MKKGSHKENLRPETMTGGIDKGFCFVYWRLSYRRKFLRTLWMYMLFVALSPLALFIPGEWTPGDIDGCVFWIEAITAIAAITLANTYRKWQAEIT